MKKNQSYAISFALYNEWLKLMMETAHMMASSGEVIFHRSQLIQQAMQGKLLWTDPEFSKMWQEKVSANMDASFFMAKHIWKQSMAMQKITPEALALKDMKALNSATTIYAKKANANAKRLGIVKIT